MNKYFAFVFVFILAVSGAHAAVTYVDSTENYFSDTISFDPDTSDIVINGFSILGSLPTTSATWRGSSATKAGLADDTNNNYQANLFFHMTPGSGSGDFVASTGGGAVRGNIAASYDGLTGTPTEFANASDFDTGPVSVTVSNVGSSDVVVAFLRVENGRTFVPDSGVTIREITFDAGSPDREGYLLEGDPGLDTISGELWQSGSTPPADPTTWVIVAMALPGEAAPLEITSVSNQTYTPAVQINWTTNNAANGTVQYGTTTSLGSSISHADLITAHSINITGLSSSTTYYFNITSCESGGNCSNYTQFNLTTKARYTLQTDTIAANTTWTAPLDVTTVFVETFGGGGGGGGAAANSNAGGGGGGGGAYAASNITVTPLSTYTVTVGSGGSGAPAGGGNGVNGSPSWFNSTSTVFAAGGGAGFGTSNSRTGGTGGTVANSIGTIRYAGGNGATGATGGGASGGGGGGAGMYEGGFNASSNTPGAGGDMFGGLGGIGQTADNNGGGAQVTGSGGGGGRCDSSCTAKSGGSGTQGFVRLSYYVSIEDNYSTFKSWYTRSGVGATNYPITMPFNVSPTDLLILVFAGDGNVTASINSTLFPGWTSLFNRGDATATVEMDVFYKNATGNDELNVTLSSAEEITYFIYALPYGGVPVANSSTGSSTNANPPPLNTGSNQKYLWLAPSAWDGGAVTISAGPSGYGNILASLRRNTTTYPIVSGGTTLHFSAQTENPGAYTSTTDQWVAATIAVPFAPPQSDSCTYTGGDWNVVCSDECTISSDTDVGDNDVFFSGVGVITIVSSITNWDTWTVTNQCVVEQTSGGGFK